MSPSPLPHIRRDATLVMGVLHTTQRPTRSSCLSLSFRHRGSCTELPPRCRFTGPFRLPRGLGGRFEPALDSRRRWYAGSQSRSAGMSSQTSPYHHEEPRHVHLPWHGVHPFGNNLLAFGHDDFLPWIEDIRSLSPSAVQSRHPPPPADLHPSFSHAKPRLAAE